jgi:nitrite reductase (cytochrome c-552)
MRRIRKWLGHRRLWAVAVGSAAATLLGLALLVSILERREAARHRFVRLVEVDPIEPDPAVWGRNFPRQHCAYLKTMSTEELVRYSKYGRYGGSEAFSKLEMHPDYRRLFAGYPFAVEYREERGHMRSFEDLLASPRLVWARPSRAPA